METEKYNEKIKLSGGFPVSGTEQLMLVHFFSICLNAKNSADTTTGFYDVTRRPGNKIEIREDCDII